MAFLRKFLATGAVALAVASGAVAATIALVGDKNDDAVWNLIQKDVNNARLAAEANGAKVNYLRLQTYDNFAPDVVQLIQAAIGQKVAVRRSPISAPRWKI
ncbi:hypothetical protein [Agrobacterium salinitolerans]|uniref:hypothetical protein n=2 Tax=Agrobacterium salinitolerans TaxID=1183413 RepID=UPI001FD969D8|nr:hypothetical protein [Agrobacterium salinitolerans]